MSDFILRTMTSADIDAVSEIERNVYQIDPWSKEQFASEFIGVPDTRFYIIAEKEGRTIGYGGLFAPSPGVEADVHDDCDRVRAVLERAGATEVRLARDEAERVRFWAGRKNAFPAVGRLSPDYYCMDGTIPRRALPGVLRGITALAEEYGLRVANVFHAGDGNMHPLILFDANQPGELDRAEALGGKILELCVKVGGSITGEHGVGREKINQMCAQFNSDELTLFHAVKAAFDPSGLLNPGKNIPTLHRCAEFGAMHVHLGQLPFPELERF